MLARVENGRAKTLAENSPVNIAALVDFVEYTLDDIKGSISHRQHPLPGQWPSSIIHEQEGKASRKKATDDTFLNAKGDKALSLLRAMNE